VVLGRLDRGVAGYGSWPLVRRWALGFEKGGVVQDVYIRFLDGGTIRFRARSFDVNVGGRLPSEANRHRDREQLAPRVVRPARERLHVPPGVPGVHCQELPQASSRPGRGGIIAVETDSW
jgi:hypothetical protein